MSLASEALRSTKGRVVAGKDVPGSVEVIRGGDVISYLGFNVALRPWVEKNGETI